MTDSFSVLTPDRTTNQQRVLLYAAGVLALVGAYFIANAALPNGLPVGVLLQGIVLGSLNALTAMGLVLIYRSIRVVNFAQAALGGLAAAISILLVTGAHWSYWIAVPIGIVAAVVTGFLVDLLVQGRFARSPRLIVTVATIGIAQIIGFITLELPHLFNGKLSAFSTFKFPINFFHHQINSINVTSDWIVAILVVPIALIGLYWFFVKTDIGVAIRGAADSQDRAQLLGIPVRNLTRITWMVAAGLSGIGAVLSQPILGANLGVTVSVGEEMLVPLAAFVLAGMDSFPMAVVWSLVIGVLQWTVSYNYNGFVYAEPALFLLIAVGLLLKRRAQVRVTGSSLGDYVAVREVAPLPNAILRLREVRIGRGVLIVVVLAVAALLPLIFSQTTVNDGIYVAIFATIAISMVILSGWAGQISLGQFALVGVGACVCGTLMVRSGLPFLLALVLGGVAGAAVALVIGIPALRLEGLSLAVITLSFAVLFNDWLGSSEFFGWSSRVAPPILFGRFDLGSIDTMYEVSLLLALFAAVVAGNLRRSRTARAILAVRDNSRAASAYGLSPLRSKLMAFAISGFLAALAGGLYVIQQGGVTSSAFSSDLSINVFIMVVIGGLGSVTGGVIGAIAVEVVLTVPTGNWPLLATGAGVLLILIFIPEGIGGLIFKARDWIAERIAARNGLSRTGEPLAGAAAAAPAGPTIGGEGSALAHTAALRLEALESLEMQGEGVGGSQADAGPPGGRPAVVAVGDLDAAYGSSQVLFDVGMGVAQREIVALLGTNGAGKTTVLRNISGLMRPKRGRVSFLGQDITPMSPVQRVQQGLVTVLGGRSVFPSLTVEENLRLASWTARRYHKDSNFAQAATDRVLALFPVLRARQHQRAGLLSGGEQQMLALGQSLLCRPKLMLIDELSLGLAPTVVADLLEVIRALAASGVTVVVVEQSVNVATAISNRAIFMERGRVRFSGPTPDLSQQPQLLRSVFLRAAERARTRKTVAAQAGVAAGAPTTDDVLAALSGGSNPPPAVPAAPTGFAPAVPALAAPVSKPTEAAFAVNGVTKGYGGVAALVDVTLSVEKGEILGIIGSNGAGKTTLFDVCSGFVRPDQGQVFMYGEDVTALSPTRRANRGLGRVFQDARIWPTMTVHEALTTALEQFNEVRDPVAAAIGLNSVVRSEEKLAVRTEEVLHELGLERFRDQFVSDLSTGTRRIVELACAVASEPRVLLLDEPTSGIAQRESEALAELLLGLRDQTGAAFIVIEHDVPLVSSIADRMVCMHLGEVIAQGDTTEVLTNPGVVAAYLGADAAAAARSGPIPERAGAAGAAEMVSP